MHLSAQVVEITPDMRSGEERVHGSIKYANQADGSDLDPTGRLMAAAQAGAVRCGAWEVAAVAAVVRKS